VQQGAESTHAIRGRIISLETGHATITYAPILMQRLWLWKCI